MHLYCDESGGTDGDLFCVSALRLEPREVERALKVFRRQTSWEGEVKGHALHAEQRLLLLELAFKTPSAAAVVVCDARTMLGGWAASTLVPEAMLRRELLSEACILAMEDLPRATCAGVTADGGRYTRKVLAEERTHLETVLRERGLLPQAKHPRLVAHASSQQHPGLQLADVVANTVHRLLRGAQPGVSPALVGLPEVLVERIQIRHVALPAHRPGWMGESPY